MAETTGAIEMKLIDQTIERYRRFVILHARCSLEKQSPFWMSPAKHLEEAVWGIEKYIDAKLRQAKQQAQQ